ncbi:hypothetical protein EVAR_21663_1 [Eumeta japonica]|uniref:Uncharacterized protein n=1 Tax=Eumeta variegata TaxID=151549 RepID=A0A4C1VGS6_EUMVA|nr:hypothetical protein EVAR_21663_1 [Eumeta japonica]
MGKEMKRSLIGWIRVRKKKNLDAGVYRSCGVVRRELRGYGGNAGEIEKPVAQSVPGIRIFSKPAEVCLRADGDPYNELDPHSSLLSHSTLHSLGCHIRNMTTGDKQTFAVPIFRPTPSLTHLSYTLEYSGFAAIHICFTILELIPSRPGAVLDNDPTIPPITFRETGFASLSEGSIAVPSLINEKYAVSRDKSSLSQDTYFLILSPSALAGRLFNALCGIS